MNPKTKKIIVYVIIGLISLPFVFALFLNIVSAVSTSASESARAAYESTMKTAQTKITDAKKAVGDACEKEIAYVNVKLADHYSKNQVLTNEEVDRLTAKSRGDNLECHKLGF